MKLKYIAFKKLKFNKKSFRLNNLILSHTKLDDVIIIKYLLNNYSVFNIIKSINNNGYFDIEPLIVFKTKNRYKVIDGNLRLASLKLLLNPKLFPLDNSNKYKYLKESKSKLSSIPCLIIKNKTDIDRMLGYKHITNINSWNIENKMNYFSKIDNSLGEDNFRYNVKKIAETTGCREFYVLKYIIISRIIKIIKSDFYFNSINYNNFNYIILLKLFDYDSIIDYLGINFAIENPIQTLNYDNLKIFIMMMTTERESNLSLLSKLDDILNKSYNSTLDYYDNNNSELIIKYDSADMNRLNRLFDKYITNNSSVLDLGFGSGRDLKYIKYKTDKTFGIDGSIEFVKKLQQDKDFTNKVLQSILPKIKIKKFDIKKFDIIISIATLMHLEKDDIKRTIINIKKYLSNQGKLIISYSTNSRDNEERYFAKISKKEMTKIFTNENFKILETIVNNDSLGRNIKWITQVYEL